MQRLSKLLICLGVSLTLGILPAQAQSQRQVAALVEALRQAAPQTGTVDDGLYSEWQIKPENIPPLVAFLYGPGADTHPV
jgi:hypothetical protein